jgi:beta-alanine degradation protein BauB
VAGERRQAMADDDKIPLGDIGTHLLYEDDEIRIWDLCLSPGEESVPHRHTCDYVIVDVAGDKIAAKAVPGYPMEYGDYIEAPVEQGHTTFLKQGSVETALNVGQKPYRNVLVEFKHTARG